MKIVRRPLDVIAIFERNKFPMPIKVRMDVDGKKIVAKIDQIVKVQHQKNVGKGEIAYTCQSCINGNDRVFELRFLLDTIEWILFKI